VSQDNNQGTGPEQNSTGLLNDPYTRRRFLRAAVVGTAGVAGAAGVAGVALARNGGKAPSTLGHVFDDLTHPPHFDDTLEETMLKGGCGNTYGSGAATVNTEAFAMFLAEFLTPGAYTFTLQQTFTPNGGSPTTGAIGTPPGGGTATLPWEYGDPGNTIFVDVETAGSITTPCTTAGTTAGTGFNPPPPTVSWTLSKTSDVLIFVHLRYDGNTPASGDSTTFTGTLSGPISNTFTLTVHVP
jgi:hypothetical protein